MRRRVLGQHSTGYYSCLVLGGLVTSCVLLAHVVAHAPLEVGVLVGLDEGVDGSCDSWVVGGSPASEESIGHHHTVFCKGKLALVYWNFVRVCQDPKNLPRLANLYYEYLWTSQLRRVPSRKLHNHVLKTRRPKYNMKLFTPVCVTGKKIQVGTYCNRVMICVYL